MTKQENTTRFVSENIYIYIINQMNK